VTVIEVLDGVLRANPSASGKFLQQFRGWSVRNIALDTARQ
jgi:hypothetical protein